MTELPRNALKAALLAGRPQFGLWCGISDPAVAEMLAGVGLDWLLFDLEHAPMDRASVLGLLQAVAPWPVSAAVRPVALDAAEIKKLLDMGAQTLVVPYVQTPDEARHAAACVAYAPEGLRGVAGTTRATRFGTVADYARRAREEICLIVQVESVAALDRLEEIAAVPGVDGVFVGPADLAASMGRPGAPGHPEVRAAVCDAIRRIRAAGKPAGVLSLDPDFLDAALEAGSLFTAIDTDMTLLQRAARARLARWR